MADLIELEQWEDGIYQLETEDPVLGGEDGIDNLQAKQLANRTKWLKAQLLLRALINSPEFTGVPKAPTAAAGTNTTQIASTAFVKAAIDALIGGAPAALDTLNELSAALAADANFAATITAALGLKATLANPVFTGNPQAPTPAAGDNDTSLATTAFVQNAVSSILIATHTISEISTNGNYVVPAGTTQIFVELWGGGAGGGAGSVGAGGGGGGGGGYSAEWLAVTPGQTVACTIGNGGNGGTAGGSGGNGGTTSFGAFLSATGGNNGGGSGGGGGNGGSGSGGDVNYSAPSGDAGATNRGGTGSSATRGGGGGGGGTGIGGPGGLPGGGGGGGGVSSSAGAGAAGRILVHY